MKGGVPSVSICIPSYREPAFVERAIRSCLSQSYRDFELLVSDDTPGDAVAQVVERLAREDSRVRYLRNPGPHGAAANSNHLAREARGEWLKFLHHDDAFAASDGLALFMAERDRGEVIFAPCLWDRGDDRGLYRITDEAYGELRRDPVATLIGRGNVIGAPSAVMVRRESFLPFEPSMVWLFDLFWYLQMALAGATFHCLERPVVLINQHDGQLTKRVEGDTTTNLRESLAMAASLRLRGAQQAMMRRQAVALARSTAGSMAWLPFLGILLRARYRPLLMARSFAAGKMDGAMGKGWPWKTE